MTVHYEADLAPNDQPGLTAYVAMASLFVTKQGVALVGAGFSGFSNLIKAAKAH